ncbi:MAG: BLUF domain-containing protein [Caulobacter sp.]|nr:BLUF domain-containing protein [Caulobacter sp.]
MSGGSFGITGEQIRAARALARLEQAELARLCGLSLETIKRLERIRGPVDANTRTLNAIIEALSGLGIQFDGCEDGGVGVCRLPARMAREAGHRHAPPPKRETQPLRRLIFHSVANVASRQDFKASIDEISRSSAIQNEQLGITGVLFSSNGRFLQVIEGPKDSVRQAFGAISCDPRHSMVTVLQDRDVAIRLFSDWSLCCGRFASDDAILKGEPSLDDGFRPETLSPAGALGLLSVVRDMQAAPPRTNRPVSGVCPLADNCLDETCSASNGFHGAA